MAESQDQVAKGNVEISKIVSSSGQSNGLELEGAGFTFFLVSDLSKLKQFEQTRSGSYTLQSILDAYIDKTYDNEHPKWDFSAETQAIAKTYEVNADEIAAYNKTLTAAGENKNGKGNGWQPTGSANEYQLAEIFSNDTGNIRVQGCPMAHIWSWKPPYRTTCSKLSLLLSPLSPNRITTRGALWPPPRTA